MNHTHRIQAHYEAQEGKSIIEIIKDKLLLDYMGRRNAKRRRILLSYAKRFDFAITDRKLRRIYTKLLPIAWCERGIFVVDDPEEVDRIISTLSKTIDTLEERKVMLRKHKQYLKFRNAGQGELFR